MCKRLRDILFPTNLLGKDVRCVEYDTSDTPYTGSNVGRHKHFDINWTGDQLVVSYTIRSAVIYGPGRADITLYRENELFSEDGASELNVGCRITQTNRRQLETEMLYIKCTNVTSLEINGETII